MLCQRHRRVLVAALSFMIALVHSSLAPSPRWGQAAAIVGGKTGAIGVNETTATNTNDLLLLNSIHSISTQSAPWALGSLDGPTTCYNSAVPGGKNNVYLVVYGGQTANGSDKDTSTSTLYYYNTLTESWFKPNIDSPPRRIEHSMATRLDTGIAYLFGGFPLTNELWSLDTVGMTWQLFPNQTYTPSPRYHHSSTLLTDGSMVVIGGFDGNNTVNMTNIYIFDTNALEWSIIMATGTPPASRRDHAATVLPDGNSVFIHGGTDKTYGTFMADIAILNCTGQTSCNWQAPPNLTPPPGRYAHTATLIDNFVIIAFGFTAKETGDSNIYIYDISKFAWVKSYQPAASYTPPPPITSSTSTTTSSTLASVGPAIPSESSPPASSSPSPSATAGATIGSIAGAAALGALVFVFYKRRNKSDGAAANRRVSSFEQHDAFSATSDSSGSGPTPLGHRFSMIFQGRNTVDSQRYSWHPSSQIRPPTMVSEYYRPNRTSTISHPGPTYNNNPRFSQHMHDMNATTEDLVGVDVGSSYFMPRRELFVVNADSDSK